ncbi:MAG: DUF1667 domain-containing protein [Treponema sp.]|nr:DUF1667 domain-containing protein [Treponema sp.]
MRSLTCIVCPIGCSLEVDDSSPDNLSVTGNKCPRGAAYAVEEIRSPKRTVTAVCRAEGASGIDLRVPVKTAVPCPKEKITALLHDIYKTKIRLPIKTGDKVIANWSGQGLDVVATRTFS